MTKQQRAAEIEARLPENLFLRALRIPATKGIGHAQFGKPQRTKDGFAAMNENIIDRSPHGKIFYDSGAEKRVMDLSRPASKLFLYILYNIQSGKDYIDLGSRKCSKKTGIKSRTTLSNAKEELAKSEFITPTTVQSIYFINPAAFFSGSRVDKFRDHIDIVHDYNEAEKHKPIPHSHDSTIQKQAERQKTL